MFLFCENFILLTLLFLECHWQGLNYNGHMERPKPAALHGSDRPLD